MRGYLVRNAFRLAVGSEGKRVSTEKNERARQLLQMKRRQEQQNEEMHAVEVASAALDPTQLNLPSWKWAYP